MQLAIFQDVAGWTQRSCDAAKTSVKNAECLLTVAGQKNNDFIDEFEVNLWLQTQESLELT